jgi:hypothetical protein
VLRRVAAGVLSPPQEEETMTFQERVGAFEAEAKGRIRRALSTGNAKLLELDETLAKVAKDDWTVPALRKQLGQLRARAETARANALKRVQEIPGDAVTRIATGTRAPVRNLARGLAEMAKRFEPPPPKPVKPVEPAGEGKVAKAS